MEEQKEKEIDAVRIHAYTARGLIVSKWSETDAQALDMASLIRNINRLELMQFPDAAGTDVFLPEKVIQDSVFKLEVRWK